MNTALEHLASCIGLARDENEGLRLAFGHACVARVEHLLEQPEVVDCLRTLGAYLHGQADRDALRQACRDAEQLANRHRGSNSIDGCGHAAVSASYAVANALQARALQAADYAAYASVYAAGGSGALGEPQSFEPEFAWQVRALTALASGQAPVL